MPAATAPEETTMMSESYMRAWRASTMWLILFGSTVKSSLVREDEPILTTTLLACAIRSRISDSWPKAG